MDRKDYPIGAYIHACSTTTNTQIENFNKFIGYLDKLEKKQKFLLTILKTEYSVLVKKLLPVPFSPVSTVRGRTFTVPPLNLPKFLTLISKKTWNTFELWKY
jgi:hypothetical protein